MIISDIGIILGAGAKCDEDRKRVSTYRNARRDARARVDQSNHDGQLRKTAGRRVSRRWPQYQVSQ